MKQENELDKTVCVEFLNPKRRVNGWCDGYLQPETRIKKGVKQVLIYNRHSPAYFIWINEENYFRHT